MLIVALVLAVVGLAALVTAVVTSNELIAWVCIAASVIGVLLLIVDALRERSRRDGAEPATPRRRAGCRVRRRGYPDETEPADDPHYDGRRTRDTDVDEATEPTMPVDQRRRRGRRRGRTGALDASACRAVSRTSSSLT